MLQVSLYLVRRLSAAVVTVAVLTLITFAMFKVIPGDEAHVAAGVAASPEQIAAMRLRLGLDRPWPVQYWDYLTRLMHGDLGTSISTHAAVSTAIAQALPQTIELVVTAMLIMVIIAVPLAVLSALRHSRGIDTALRATVVLSAGLPTFWLALVAQHLLASQRGWFPISGAFAPHTRFPAVTGFPLLDALLDGNPGAFADGFYHLLLPGLVLALPFTGQLYRTLRTDLIGVLEQEFIIVARAKGTPTWPLIRRHLLPNAAGSAITVFGATFAMMTGAALLVESVFGLNGIGAFLTQAVANTDRFAVIGGVLVIGVLVVASSLVVDLVHLVRDPRIRAGELVPA